MRCAGRGAEGCPARGRAVCASAARPAALPAGAAWAPAASLLQPVFVPADSAGHVSAWLRGLCRADFAGGGAECWYLTALSGAQRSRPRANAPGSAWYGCMPAAVGVPYCRARTRKQTKAAWRTSPKRRAWMSPIVPSQGLRSPLSPLEFSGDHL